MINLLCDYLKINTAHPNPDYNSVVQLFKKHAHADGFLIKELFLSSGNPVLIITYQGTDSNLPALALNHHMDVVPVNNASEWDGDPFGGFIRDNIIIGRGTQDMKGVGVDHYSALKELKKFNHVPKRTIHLLLVPDEERGGFKGTKELIDHPEFASLKIGYVLDEGLPSGNDKELFIKTEERTTVQIKVVSKGPMAHASGLMNTNSIHELVSFLNDIVCLQQEQKKRALSQPPGKLLSMHITSLTTHNTTLNVIPSEAQATIDIRMPSHVRAEEIIVLLDNLLKKYGDITYEILATSTERLTPHACDGLFYKTLSDSIKAHDFIVRDLAFEATTDSRFYSARGIEGLGCTPFTVKSNLHGTNECIRLEDLEHGKAIFFTFLNKFCM